MFMFIPQAGVRGQYLLEGPLRRSEFDEHQRLTQPRSPHLTPARMSLLSKGKETEGANGAAYGHRGSLGLGWVECAISGVDMTTEPGGVGQDEAMEASGLPRRLQPHSVSCSTSLYLGICCSL